LTFRPVRITAVQEESRIHQSVTLAPANDADAAVLATTAPGQYVRFASASGVQGLYALANPPGEAWQVLIKRDASSLSGAEVGDERLVTPPQGRGFPVREHAGRDLVLVGAGTGIAPLRGVLRQVVAERASFGRVALVYGQRTLAEMAYAPERAAWIDRGVEITLVTSREGEPRYVQDVVAGMSVRGAIAYVCGMPAMVDAVTRVLHGAGVGEEHVFLNH
jgi:ferredoxin-NADP reductase